MCQPLTAEGEFALVREHLEIALSQPSIGWIAFGDHELYNLLADVATQQRDEAALQKYASLAEEFASRYDHKLYRAIAHRAWGVFYRLAGQYAEADERLIQALEIFRQLNTHWQIGRTLVEMGELEVARTDNAVAREYLSQALRIFEKIESVLDATRTHERLAALEYASKNM
jgi:tetratricopeptide (TPR) repeat protein